MRVNLGLTSEGSTNPPPIGCRPNDSPNLSLLKSALFNGDGSDAADRSATHPILDAALNSDLLSPSQRFFVKNGAGYHLFPRSPNYAEDASNHFSHFQLSGNVCTPTRHNHRNITFRLERDHHSDRCEIRMLKTVASAYMRLYDNAQPSSVAIERSHAAKKYFFETVTAIFSANSTNFGNERETDRETESSPLSSYPLNRLNKALVFTDVDGKVVIGMSEGRNKHQDKGARQALLNIVQTINRHQSKYQFFLAAQPTNEEYYILRDLLQNDSLKSGSSYLPMMHYLSDMRARCAEVAVVFTLHKMGLASVNIASDRANMHYNFALVATSGAIFGDAKCETLSSRLGGGINPFDAQKYTTSVTRLESDNAFIANWKMCSEHCAPLSKVLYIIPICSKILGGLKFER